MSVNFADLVVLGDDLSGITAGSLLAKRGLNVLVVDRPAPERPISLAGLESRLFKSIVGKMGIAEGRMRALRKNKIGFQVILPGHRIDVSANTEHLLQEIRREFPYHLDWARKLFEEIEETYNYEAGPLLGLIPWATWRERRRFLKQKSDYGWPRWTEELQKLPVPMQALFKAWILFLAGNPTSFADSFQPFSLLTEEARSTVMVKGGWNELKRMFLEKVEYYGGTVLPDHPNDYEFETDSSRIKGIAFDGYHFTTRCRYLISNDSIMDLLAHLPRTFRTKRYCRMMNRNPSSREFSVQFLTSSEIIPEPMCQDALVIQDEKAPLIGTNYFRVQVIPLPDPPDAQEDTLLHVTYFLPADETIDDTAAIVDGFETRHDEIETKLRALMPFAQGRLRRIFPITSTNQGDLFDDPRQDYSRFLEEAERAPRFPPSFSFPGLKTPYENLLTLGPDQLSWLGLGGRLQGAMKAVDFIWARESKTRNFK